MTPSTFSLIGFDPANGDLGIAVASKFLAVGSVVPWAQAGVGAIATQSWANTSYGMTGVPSGLSPMQLSALARILAMLVLPMPRGPEKR
jgi:uncharacterized Ntn-hydrolase superfamily protein